jgi:hypothetical protein
MSTEPLDHRLNSDDLAEGFSAAGSAGGLVGSAKAFFLLSPAQYAHEEK